MSGEKMYTLDEAQRELERQECRTRGHSWDVIETMARLGITCDRCTLSYPIADAAKS